MGMVKMKGPRALIREDLSPHLTNMSSRLGFANRGRIVENLKTKTLAEQNRSLDLLRDNGILKGRFRSDIQTISQLEPHMLKLGITESKLLGTSLFGEQETTAFFSEASHISHKIRLGISSGLENLPYSMPSGGKIAEYVLLTTLSAFTALGIAETIHSTPDIDINMRSAVGLGLALLTTLGAIGYKYADRLPIHDIRAKLAHIGSRIVLPLSLVTDGAYFAHLLHETNMAVTNLFGKIGFGGTAAVLTGIFYLIVRSRNAALKEHLDSYGGHIDPGNIKITSRMMRLVNYTLIMEGIYLFVIRLPLFGAAIEYMTENVVPHAGTLGNIALLAPAIFYGITQGLRHWSIDHDNATWSRWSDHLKGWLPFYGAGAGLAISLVAAGVSGSWIVPIAFATFWGSTAFLFFKEFHGIGHSANTNLGFKAALCTSTVDVIGETEQKASTRNSRVAIFNLYTSVEEHTDGILFSALLNKKAWNSFLCLFDRIPFELVDGKYKWLDHIEADKNFIERVKEMQSYVFDRLFTGINGGPLKKKYETLINTLRGLSDYYKTDLQEEIKNWVADDQAREAAKQPVVFWKGIEEARIASLQALMMRGEEFSEIADRLCQKVRNKQISNSDFYKEWSDLLLSFDKDYIEIIALARKHVFGDDLKQRKVENVASVGLFRGLTMYKAWINDGKPETLHDWIYGEWTRIANPEFRYDEPKKIDGSPNVKASKYIWIRSEHVVLDIQRIYADCLSTSPFIERIENEPTDEQGFAKGDPSKAIKVNINGKEKMIGEYYFSKKEDQNTAPSGKAVPRKGVESLPEDYVFATGENSKVEGLKEKAIRPAVFTIPLWDYSLIMDKDDVQVDSYLIETALLLREERDIRALLIFKYPIGRKFSIENPFPNREVDTSKGLEYEDANVEIIYEFQEKGRKVRRVIPYNIDRSYINMRKAPDDVDWKNLKGAKLENGVFYFIYGRKGQPDFELPIDRRDMPEIASLGLKETDNVDDLLVNNFTETPDREGDATWFRVHYKDNGPDGFVRVWDHNRPIMVTKMVVGENSNDR